MWYCYFFFLGIFITCVGEIVEDSRSGRVAFLRAVGSQLTKTLKRQLSRQLLLKVSIQLLSKQGNNLGKTEVVDGGCLLGLALGSITGRLHQTLARLVVEAHESLQLMGGVLPASNVERDPGAGAQVCGQFAVDLGSARSQVNHSLRGSSVDVNPDVGQDREARD
ncbi:MAG: hypothetical protein J3R72DRAFT_219554 [Linnemannia gamsii]|nr:MAG: hypothetical protein J3R72DRAFT_219554 [Linnemannia gamsii]